MAETRSDLEGIQEVADDELRQALIAERAHAVFELLILQISHTTAGVAAEHGRRDMVGENLPCLRHNGQLSNVQRHRLPYQHQQQSPDLNTLAIAVSSLFSLLAPSLPPRSVPTFRPLSSMIVEFLTFVHRLGRWSSPTFVGIIDEFQKKENSKRSRSVDCGVRCKTTSPFFGVRP